MRLRVRGPNGVATLSLSEQSTVSDLRREISEKTELPAFDLKSGFPPEPLELEQFADDVRLLDTGIKFDGEQLIAIRKDIAAALKKPIHKPDLPAAQSLPTQQRGQMASESRPPPPPPPPDPTRAELAISPSKATTAPPEPPLPSSSELDPPEIPLPALSSTLVLRVMPDDNSCLFRALSSAVLGTSIDSMTELRSIVAQTIQGQPDTYNAAVLDKQPEAYCKWIQREDAWGGAIELAILSQHFDVEVCSVNVQDLRVDRFNEGKSSRVILVYSGIHYDVVALSPSEPPHVKADLPAEFDIKIFETFNKEPALAGALELCKVLQSRHYYTDTAGFTVKCNICGWTGIGEEGATEHAKGTGHMNFGEAE